MADKGGRPARGSTSATRLISARLTDAESLAFDELIASTGLSGSQLIRLWLSQATGVRDEPEGMKSIRQHRAEIAALGAAEEVAQVGPGRAVLAPLLGLAAGVPGPRLVVLVGCAAQKGAKAAPAAELYTSPLFRKSLAFARQQGGEVRIVSAEHGLMRPEDITAPYERKLSSLSKARKLAWGQATVGQLFAEVGVPAHVMILAGEDYVNALRPALAHTGATVSEPLAGLTIGQRLAWLKKQLPAEAPASRGPRAGRGPRAVPAAPAVAGFPPRSHPTAPAGAEGESLEAFAARINKAAELAPPWMGTSSKRYLGDVARPEDWRRLWEAHAKGLITLSRLDLVEAADPVKLAQSRLVIGSDPPVEFNLIDAPQAQREFRQTEPTAPPAAPPPAVEALPIAVTNALEELARAYERGPITLEEGRAYIARVGGAPAKDVWAALNAAIGSLNSPNNRRQDQAMQAVYDAIRAAREPERLARVAARAAAEEFRKTEPSAPPVEPPALVAAPSVAEASRALYPQVEPSPLAVPRKRAPGVLEDIKAELAKDLRMMGPEARIPDLARVFELRGRSRRDLYDGLEDFREAGIVDMPPEAMPQAYPPEDQELFLPGPRGSVRSRVNVIGRLPPPEVPPGLRLVPPPFDAGTAQGQLYELAKAWGRELGWGRSAIPPRDHPEEMIEDAGKLVGRGFLPRERREIDIGFAEGWEDSKTDSFARRRPTRPRTYKPSPEVAELLAQQAEQEKAQRGPIAVPSAGSEFRITEPAPLPTAPPGQEAGLRGGEFWQALGQGRTARARVDVVSGGLVLHQQMDSQGQPVRQSLGLSAARDGSPLVTYLTFPRGKKLLELLTSPEWGDTGERAAAGEVEPLSLVRKLGRALQENKPLPAGPHAAPPPAVPLRKLSAEARTGGLFDLETEAPQQQTPAAQVEAANRAQGVIVEMLRERAGYKDAKRRQLSIPILVRTLRSMESLDTGTVWNAIRGLEARGTIVPISNSSKNDAGTPELQLPGSMGLKYGWITPGPTWRVAVGEAREADRPLGLFEQAPAAPPLPMPPPMPVEAFSVEPVNVSEQESEEPKKPALAKGEQEKTTEPQESPAQKKTAGQRKKQRQGRAERIASLVSGHNAATPAELQGTLNGILAMGGATRPVYLPGLVERLAGKITARGVILAIEALAASSLVKLGAIDRRLVPKEQRRHVVEEDGEMFGYAQLLEGVGVT